jgi:hypothetical protein
MIVKIVTNNHPRTILSWYDLTPAEQKEFDYLEEGEGSFFRYKNHVYDLGEFMRVDHTAISDKWKGYVSDSYFSGVLVRYTSDCDQVIVGQYFH